MTSTADNQWFGVRCIMRFSEEGAYEERVTIWQCPTVEQAIFLAEGEAREYAQEAESSGISGISYVGLAQAYRMTDIPAHGAEVFSLLRDSDLEPDDYVNRFFDTAKERQGTLGEDSLP